MLFELNMLYSSYIYNSPSNAALREIVITSSGIYLKLRIAFLKGYELPICCLHVARQLLSFTKGCNVLHLK